MNILRLAAVLLVVTGAALVLAGLAPRVHAVDCNPVYWSPATCTPAHALPPSQNPSGGYCEVDGEGDCVATGSSLCSDVYGTAIVGECEHELNYENPTSCMDEVGVTVVEVHRYDAACEFVNEECICKFVKDTGTSPALVEVCQCSESPL